MFFKHQRVSEMHTIWLSFKVLVSGTLFGSAASVGQPVPKVHNDIHSFTEMIKFCFIIPGSEKTNIHRPVHYPDRK